MPIQPQPTPARTTGLLKHNDIPAFQLDAGLELWDHILSPQYLSGRTYQPQQISGNRHPPNMVRPVGKAGFAKLRDEAAKNISEAKAVLRDPARFYDIHKLQWAFGIIRQAQQVIYHAYGTFISHNITFWPGIGADTNRLSDSFALSSNKDCNPFIETIESCIVPVVEQFSPDLICIDIQWSWETVQLLTLNLILKKHFPSVHINCTGHGFDQFSFSRLTDRLKQDSRLFLGCDSLFVYPSDTGVLQLASSTPDSLNDIENLAHIKNGIVQVNMPLNPEAEPVDACIPDYSDLPLKRYLSPHLVLSDRLSIRCYWAKCHYCSINADKPVKRTSQPKHLIDRLKTYRELYNCRHIMFLDEACHPDLASQTADTFLDGSIDCTWSLRTRVDSRYTLSALQKLHLAGCRELIIGLEAVHPELLESMHKTDHPDTYADTAAELVRSCSSVGIGIHFCLLLGFPTERDHHLDSLVSFVRQQAPHLSRTPLYLSFNHFRLTPGSYMYHNPGLFNITEIVSDPELFNMDSIPCITVDGRKIAFGIRPLKYLKHTETIMRLIADRSKRLLYDMTCKSPYELLLKEEFGGKRLNPLLEKK